MNQRGEKSGSCKQEFANVTPLNVILQMTQARRPAGKDTKTSSLTPSAILISHIILAWHVIAAA